MSDDVQTIYSAVLRWHGGELEVDTTSPAHSSMVAFADSPFVAASLLHSRGECRINASDKLLGDIRRILGQSK